jgi:hypothetical protein
VIRDGLIANLGAGRARGGGHVHAARFRDVSPRTRACTARGTGPHGTEGPRPLPSEKG